MFLEGTMDSIIINPSHKANNNTKRLLGFTKFTKILIFYWPVFQWMIQSAAHVTLSEAHGCCSSNLGTLHLPLHRIYLPERDYKLRLFYGATMCFLLGRKTILRFISPFCGFFSVENWMTRDSRITNNADIRDRSLQRVTVLAVAWRHWEKLWRTSEKPIPGLKFQSRSLQVLRQPTAATNTVKTQNTV